MENKYITQEEFNKIKDKGDRTPDKGTTLLYKDVIYTIK